MATITYDTHKFIRRLKDAGIPEEQAEAISEAQREVLMEVFENRDPATSTDIRELELQITARIAETKADLVRWVIAAGFLQTALITPLLIRLVK